LKLPDKKLSETVLVQQKICKRKKIEKALGVAEKPPNLDRRIVHTEAFQNYNYKKRSPLYLFRFAKNIFNAEQIRVL